VVNGVLLTKVGYPIACFGLQKIGLQSGTEEVNTFILKLDLKYFIYHNTLYSLEHVK